MDGEAADSSLLVLSDIHLNPLADPELKARLVSADISQWEDILSSPPSQTLSKPGEDTNWPLLRSAFRSIATIPRKPNLVFITGDLFAHHLHDHLNLGSTAAPDFASFARQTALFLEKEFKAAIPGVPIVMALGNNDGDCEGGDYSIQPRGAFLQSVLPAIADAANVNAEDIKASWVNYGSYDIPSPVLRHHRLIVLNTTFLSARYQNACGDHGDDPGKDMLKWLSDRLAAAKSRKEKVWLIYHIPPGIDAFASTHPKVPNPEKIVTMWNPRYETEFENILSRYAAVVQTQFAGHTHFDDFRLLGPPGAYSSYVLLNSGLSPNVGQNPAFRQITFKSDGTLTDFTTWALPLPQDSWNLEYKFRSEWKLKTIDLPGLSKLYSLIHQDPALRAHWQRIYAVGSLGKGGMAEKESAATSCATGNSHPSDFRLCVCATVPTLAFCKN